MILTRDEQNPQRSGNCGPTHIARRTLSMCIVGALIVAAGLALFARARSDGASSERTSPPATSVADSPTTTLDPAGPVAVTGLRIGESDPSNPLMPGMSSDGSMSIRDIPDWIAVGNPADPDAGCIGYVRKDDLYPKDLTPETANRPIVIYDEEQRVIGEISNGRTVLYGK
jgi:hypothetical protein